jgi:acetate kinase
MRSFRRTLAGVPLVAAFETGFHRDIPPRRRWYAVPAEWEKKYGIRRYGYHGASHRYVAWRLNQLMGRHARKVVSLHLGGSSSLCAIRDGVSVATSMGFSPQSGVPQSRRVGDFDSFALSLVARETHQSLDAMLAALGSSGGLASMSGTSGDFRDIAAAADAGDARAKLARDVFVTSVRDYLGAYLVELGGADVIVFTGGIGQNSSAIRSAVCRGMDFMGILLDDAKNALAKDEARIDSAGSKTAIWVLPANEELIVARQAVQLLRDYGMVREDKNAIGDW